MENIKSLFARKYILFDVFFAQFDLILLGYLLVFEGIQSSHSLYIRESIVFYTVYHSVFVQVKTLAA